MKHRKLREQKKVDQPIKRKFCSQQQCNIRKVFIRHRYGSLILGAVHKRRRPFWGRAQNSWNLPTDRRKCRHWGGGCQNIEKKCRRCLWIVLNVQKYKGLFLEHKKFAVQTTALLCIDLNHGEWVIICHSQFMRNVECYFSQSTNRMKPDWLVFSKNACLLLLFLTRSCKFVSRIVLTNCWDLKTRKTFRKS